MNLGQISSSISIKLHICATSCPENEEFKAPVVDAPVRPPDLWLADEAKEVETEWLTTFMAALRKDSLESGDWISWSAYHAHIQQAVIPPDALNALLALFLDNAHSVAMLKHSMDVINAAVQHINPGQVTVIAVD